MRKCVEAKSTFRVFVSSATKIYYPLIGDLSDCVRDTAFQTGRVSVFRKYSMNKVKTKTPKTAVTSVCQHFFTLLLAKPGRGSIEDEEEERGEYIKQGEGEE